MPDFNKVPAPMFSPTRCAACSTHACHEGFVDFVATTATQGFENGAPMQPLPGEPMYGRLYLCARCVWTAARLVGCLDPQQADELTALTVRASAEADVLRDELAAERASKLSAEDVAALKALAARKPARKPEAT